jgi:hypothetical protein
MKTQVVGSVSEFLNGRQVEESLGAKVERHINKYGSFYRIGAVTVIVLLSGSHAFATVGGIEIGAEKLYEKLLSIGKWIIIFKGGFDTIKHMAGGDFDSAKKGIFSYLLVYIFLFGLPWAMDEVDMIFKDLKV